VTGGETVSFQIEAPSDERDRLVAEMYALGSLGLEENDAGFTAYFPTRFAERPERDVVLALADPARRISIAAPEAVPAADWEAGWREGLAPRQVGPLWIRPSWCDSQGQPELCIDPQQAFGSGEHATTRIALRGMLHALRPGDRVLDVGSGSGILALGALRMGAATALGCDLERPACLNAGENARRNGLPLDLFCGTLTALSPELGFELVLANMLWSELAPLIERVAEHCRRDLVVSGALERERARILERLGGLGFELGSEWNESQSGDDWWGGAFRRPLQASSPRT